MTVNSVSTAENFSEASTVDNLWLPMCGGLSVAYNQCCNTISCDSNGNMCEMFFDGAAALLVNLVQAQDRMARKK